MSNQVAQSKDAIKKDKRLARLEKYSPVDTVIQQLADDQLMPLVRGLRVVYACRGKDPRQDNSILNPTVEIQGYVNADWVSINAFRTTHAARLESIALNKELKALWHRFCKDLLIPFTRTHVAGVASGHPAQTHQAATILVESAAVVRDVITADRETQLRTVLTQVDVNWTPKDPGTLYDLYNDFVNACGAQVFANDDGALVRAGTQKVKGTFVAEQQAYAQALQQRANVNDNQGQGNNRGPNRNRRGQRPPGQAPNARGGADAGRGRGRGGGLG